MKFWLLVVPCVGLSPVICRYLRIQSKTNPFLKEVYRHTSGKVLSSFIPLEGPFQDILKDTVYECVENRTLLADYFAKHLLLQFISHEITEGVHEVVKKLSNE